MRIYKINGSKKEYVKYKGNPISVSDYKNTIKMKKIKIFLFIKNNKMDTVDETNKLWRSWGPCSQSMKDDLNYIIKIINTSFNRDIIKKNEYRNYLMIITNNCNQYIEQKFEINKIELMKQIKYEKAEKEKNRDSDTIKTFDDDIIIINDEKDLNIKFDAKYTTYNDFFLNKNLLNENYNNTIFKISGENTTHVIYVKVTKKDDESSYKIIDIETGDILNNTSFKFKIKHNDISYGDSVNKEITHACQFTSIAIINDAKKADQYKIENNIAGGGILSKNKGKKGVYKSTKQKISVIIDKKPCDRTVYKNAKGISYIRCNNEYKLLKKYKLAKK